MEVPFLDFSPMHSSLREEMLREFTNVYDSNWYILGEKVRNFELAYSKFTGVSFTVGLSNGLDALQLSLRTLGITTGDEVIVPSNTYIATWLAVSLAGAKPVAVEPDIETYNIDVNKIEEAITPNTKAIMPVHLYGQACQMDQIMDLARKHNLFVVEDNAQSQGATYNNKATGSFGHLNATSFYPGKNLGALGDAGAITTDNFEFAKKVRILRNYGSEVKYFNSELGYNMRLDELQAAFLSLKLNHLESWIFERQKIASIYSQELQNTGDLVLPKIADDATHVYHLYVVRTKLRDKLMTYLEKRGIGCLIHYPVPPHLQKSYEFLAKGKGAYPIAENLAETIFSLPLWIGMNEIEIEYVIDNIKKYFK